MNNKLIEKLGFSKGPWTMMLNSKKEITVRNRGGILFTFWKPTKWPEQFERLERETKESFLNAHIVAAAPEMLESLIESCFLYEFTMKEKYKKYGVGHDYYHAARLAFDKTKTIAEKAIGKSLDEIKALLKC